MTLPLFNDQLEALRRRRRIEDEELLGRAPKRRRRRLEETERKLGATSYLTFTDINWFAPSFLVEDVRGIAGVRIPFVGLTSITKCDVPRSPDGRTYARYPDQAKAAEGHFGYIERQDRAARNRGERHLDYIERGEARDGESETGYYAYVLTNIHRNPDIRRDFARRVWAAERSPHVPRLLAWSTDAEWWAERASRADAPDWVRSAAERVAGAVKKAEAKPKPGNELKPFQVDLGATTLEEAYERLTWSDERMDAGDLPKLDFSSRYGGRVQHRLVFELPYGLTARERFEVARGIARWCKQQRFMYVIAIHKPDGHNDSRNFHVHVDFYDRPCRWLKRFGMWDFQVSLKAKNGDIRYPYRQRKRLSHEESREGAWWEQRAQLLKTIRSVVVDTTNDVLERSGLSVRYHTGPASELGLEITPMKKLGGRKMAAERAGVETQEGNYNAEALWGDRKRAIEAAHAENIRRDREMLAKLRAALFATGRAHNVSGMELQTEIAGIADACEAMRQRRFKLDVVNLEFEKAASRAKAVLREAAKADERQVRDPSFKNSEFRTHRTAIVADAQRHLEYVESIAPTKEDLAEVESDIALLERSVQVLRQRASAAIAELESEQKEKAIRLDVSRLKSSTASKALSGFALQDVERLRAWLKANRDRVTVDSGALVIPAQQAILTIIAKHHDSREVQDLLGLVVIDCLIKEARRDCWPVVHQDGLLHLPSKQLQNRPFEAKVVTNHVQHPAVQLRLRKVADEQGRELTRILAAIDKAEWLETDGKPQLANDAFPDLLQQIERWRHADEVRDAIARRRLAMRRSKEMTTGSSEQAGLDSLVAHAVRDLALGTPVLTSCPAEDEDIAENVTLEFLRRNQKTR